ncbi:hypothetical protein OH768_08830 [Streptomyces sp. NBC_01622]|uniref:hypothetical protein n=1 Tax=Streptomyces sp. NBC_01622 TaxID=2975903 RepID=UPI003867CFCC|nr:hypothetical protein OH768_08830 [Streptomyces sp. NBC_01622]
MGLGGGQIDVVVGRAQHRRRPDPAEVQQGDPGRGGRRHQPCRGPRTDAVAGDGQPRESSVRCLFQGVGQLEGALVAQPGGGYVEFVDRALGEDGGEGCRAVRTERVAADEDAFDAPPISGSGEQRIGEDGHALGVEPGLHEVQRAQRPRGLDEFGRRPPTAAAQRIALEPHPGHDLRRGTQLVGDPAGTAGRDPVAAQVERLDLTAPTGHDLGTLVTEPVRTEQQVPYGRRTLGQCLGDAGGALRTQALLAQIEPPVRQRRSHDEVQPLPGRPPGPQPVEQRPEFGDRTRRDVNHPGEADRARVLPVPAHHAASR